MRLDHLLSTENSGFCLEAGVCHADADSRCPGRGCWCGRDQWLAVPLGMAGVVWVCFWVPGPPPHGGFHCGAVPMPMRSTRGTPSAGPAGARGAWRFENWIVDASEGKRFRFPFAYRDFAKLFIF